jgi:EAL domain-containing protein (putative c-di-GMP-specific phosphodiesterase class I)
MSNSVCALAYAEKWVADVIAKGRETDEQQQFLESAGCNHYQGYLFGRPVPMDKFEAFRLPLVG